MQARVTARESAYLLADFGGTKPRERSPSVLGMTAFAPFA